MNKLTIQHILEAIEKGELKADDALIKLQNLPFTDIGHTKTDNHRSSRSGYPEVIYGENKTTQQVVDIFQAMLKKQSNILATRVNDEMAVATTEICYTVVHNSMARTLFFEHEQLPEAESAIVIVTASTADLAVAKETKVTAEALGNKGDNYF